MNEIDKQRAFSALKVGKAIIDFVDDKRLLEKNVIRSLTLLERVSKFGVESDEVILAYSSYSITRNRMEQLGMDIKSYDAYVRLILLKEDSNNVQN